MKKSINDLEPEKWREYTDIDVNSFWALTYRDNTGSHSSGYPGNFVPQIPYQMMRRYTKKYDYVLDPFVGGGTTGIEAKKLGRNFIGIDIQKESIERTRKLIEEQDSEFNTKYFLVVGDSTKLNYNKLLNEINVDRVQLVIAHPPYWNIIKYSDEEGDLSRCANVDSFLRAFSDFVEATGEILEDGRYFIVVMGDKYQKGEVVPLGFLTMQAVLNKNYILKGIIVKNFGGTTGKRSVENLWRYRALRGGFYIFKHDYIFVFKKVKK